MKVKDLLEEVNKCKDRYGDDFLDWDIYTEQCTEDDKNYKRTKQNWKTIMCPEDWEYFEFAGFWTKIIEKKIFTINVNY